MCPILHENEVKVKCKAQSYIKFALNPGKSEHNKMDRHYFPDTLVWQKFWEDKYKFAPKENCESFICKLSK